MTPIVGVPGTTVPERRCLVTGERGAIEPLIGLLGPADDVVPDVDERLPGRGMWVTADRAVLTRAVDRRAFSRGAKRSVIVSDDLLTQVEGRLLDRFQRTLGLARRAGCAFAGQEKVEEAARSGRIIGLVEATDPGDHARVRGLDPAVERGDRRPGGKNLGSPSTGHGRCMWRWWMIGPVRAPDFWID